MRDSVRLGCVTIPTLRVSPRVAIAKRVVAVGQCLLYLSRKDRQPRCYGRGNLKLAMEIHCMIWSQRPAAALSKLKLRAYLTHGLLT